MKIFGPVQQKILLILLGVVATGFAMTPRQHSYILKAIRKDWQRINKQSFNRSIKSLRQQRLLQELIRADGTVTLHLTRQGQRQAKYFGFFGSTVKIKRPKKWDKLWRIVIFDIPEKKRTFRDILRDHLRAIGFEKLQQSVFVFPYPCEKEIVYLAELYNATAYVRIITAQKIDNQKSIMKKFKID